MICLHVEFTCSRCASVDAFDVKTLQQLSDLTSSFACRLLPVMAAGADMDQEFVVCCLACSKSTPFDADKVRIGRGGEIERGPKGSTS